MSGRVLLIDLGGGSCEITLSENKRIVETISLPLGAVRLTEGFLTLADPPPAEGLAQMRQLIARELRRARRRIPQDKSVAGDRNIGHRRGFVRCLRGSDQVRGYRWKACEEGCKERARQGARHGAQYPPAPPGWRPRN